MKNSIRIVLTTIVILIATNFVFGQPGFLPADLDQNFGPNNDGYQRMGLGTTAEVIAGFHDDIYVNHGNSFSVHRSDGSQYASVQCPFSYCSAMTLQANGLVLMAGTDSFGRMGLARYDGNFQLDQTFGSGGITLASFGRRFTNTPRAVLESNGSIYITGFAGFSGSYKNQFTARFKSNGSLDSGFASTGYVLESSIYYGNAIAKQKGNLVVAGYRRDAAVTFNETTITVYDQFGRRATSFNGGQIFAIAGLTPAMKVDTEYRIVFTGPTNGVSSGIVRLYPNGQLDQTFDGTGIVWFPVQNSANLNAIAFDRQNRILVGGTWSDFTQITGGIVPQRPVIARFDYLGNLDRTFENSIPSQFNYPFGIRIFDYTISDPRIFSGIALQSNGNIVVGEYQNLFQGECELLRLNGN
jgi:uncharacterized delta-60 repeat protein